MASGTMPRPPRGTFRKQGTIHVHVDCRDDNRLRDVASWLQKLRVQGKVTTITDSVRGSLHPGGSDDHHAGGGPETFLSLAVKNRGQAVLILRELLRHLNETAAIGLEAERVLGYLSSNSLHTPITVGMSLTGEIDQHEVGYEKLECPDPVEIHHCFDLRRSVTPPFGLAQLAAELEERNLPVRTWSLFERDDVWSFRSTVFTDAFSFPNRCNRELAIVQQFLRENGLRPTETWIVAEEILGLWKTPATVCGLSGSKPHEIQLREVLGKQYSSIRLQNFIVNCQSSPTRDTAEQTREATDQIHAELSPLQEVAKACFFEPILVELAINTSVTGHATKDSRFVSQIATYSDNDCSTVLESWQNAIAEIVGDNDDLQINPIVSHPTTYDCALLFEKLGPIVERVYDTAVQPGQEGQPVVDVLGRHLGGRQLATSYKACRKSYDYNQEVTSSPAELTVRALCRGLVAGLMSSLQKGHLTATDSAAVLHVLRQLTTAFLLVVPFRWPIYSRADTLLPGGCVFLVAEPIQSRPVTREDLIDLALRLGFMLQEAALREGRPIMNIGGQLPEITAETFRELERLRKFFRDHDIADEARRIQLLKDNFPFIRETSKPDRLAEILSDPWSAETPFKLISTLHGSRMVKSTYLKKLNQAVERGLLARHELAAPDRREKAQRAARHRRSTK